MYFCVQINKKMAKKVKLEPKKVYSGKNVRLSDDAHDKLTSYCKKQGRVFSTFVEKAALEKMQDEIDNEF